MDRNKKIGILWLVVPFVTMVGSMLAFMIIALLFGFTVNPVSGLSQLEVMGTGVLTFFTMLFLVGVVAFFIGIPLGIIYLSRAKKLSPPRT